MLDTFTLIFVFLGSFLSWYLIYLVWKKRRYQASDFKNLDLIDDDIDYEKLNKAQEIADKMDLRAELLKDHQCIHTFYSLHGADEHSMYKLIGQFREQGIHSDFIFIQSMPTGTASYVGNTGTYEFFVEREKLQEAQNLLDKILKS